MYFFFHSYKFIRVEERTSQQRNRRFFSKFNVDHDLPALQFFLYRYVTAYYNITDLGPMKSHSWNQMTLTIVNIEEFSRANVVFSACLVKIKEITDKVKHKDIRFCSEKFSLRLCNIPTYKEQQERLMIPNEYCSQILTAW